MPEGFISDDPNAVEAPSLGSGAYSRRIARHGAVLSHQGSALAMQRQVAMEAAAKQRFEANRQTIEMRAMAEQAKISKDLHLERLRAQTEQHAAQAAESLVGIKHDDPEYRSKVAGILAQYPGAARDAGFATLLKSHVHDYETFTDATAKQNQLTAQQAEAIRKQRVDSAYQFAGQHGVNPVWKQNPDGSYTDEPDFEAMHKAMEAYASAPKPEDREKIRGEFNKTAAIMAGQDALLSSLDGLKEDDGAGNKILPKGLEKAYADALAKKTEAKALRDAHAKDHPWLVPTPVPTIAPAAPTGILNISTPAAPAAAIAPAAVAPQIQMGPFPVAGAPTGRARDKYFGGAK